MRPQVLEMGGYSGAIDLSEPVEAKFYLPQLIEGLPIRSATLTLPGQPELNVPELVINAGQNMSPPYFQE